MSDALPIPPGADLEQYRNLACDFQSACKSGEPGAIRDWARRWAEELARLRAIEITPETQRQIDFEAEDAEKRWDRFQKTNEGAAPCTPADAQLFVARGHGFASWPKFANHLEALACADSSVSLFEAAVDAIVSGDAAALQKLLQAHPELAQARSTREHRSTLLHYISANGVEDFRQKTPKNIVEIAELLASAGADVNAESDAYGGRSTALGLTATSCHPENASVQIALMELLIDRGAILEWPEGAGAVNGCLANGRGQAAEFLAGRGARLDLEAAAGVGRLDIVKSYFQEDGALKSPDMQKQMWDGFGWACEFGRAGVVEFLLRSGIEIDAKGKPHGQTGLHWAAYGGHAAIVKLLVESGAPIDAKDDHYGGTPLEWALYAWENSSNASNRESYYGVVAQLVRAGGFPRLADSSARIRSDPRMLEALNSETDTRS